MPPQPISLEIQELGYLSCTALGYGLDDRKVDSRQGLDGNLFLYRVQTGSGVHPASYPMGMRDSFSGDKAAGA
jgi:hypothetical protein